ncbi:hypothetical protein NMY22_g10707 [Coprinellus aureogranulatus]|nr:hypothetical protein NMY22_g10707 [Coprinellus aureogranulatus]
MSTSEEKERSVFSNDFIALWKTFPLDMHLEVLKKLTLRELVVLSDTDSFGAFAHAELRARLRRLLRNWDLSFDGTLQALDQYRSVMSGSSILNMCVPGDWSPGDLDFYCPLGKKDNMVRHFEGEGYSVVPKEDVPSNHHTVEDASPMNPDYHMELLKEVVFLRKDAHKINIIESAVPCAEAPIFLFHSTVVMNFLTSKGVTCLYPHWTLNSKGVVNHRSGRQDWLANEEKETRVLDKYRDRGYTIAEDCADLHAQDRDDCEVCSLELSVSAHKSLVMPFDKGTTLLTSTRSFAWRLGSFDTLEVRFGLATELLDRGAIVLVEGDGDGRAYLYDGLTKTVKQASASTIARYCKQSHHPVFK